MMFSRRATRGVALTAAACLASLAACSPPPPPTAEQRANQATVAACRQRADAVFAQQNRAAVFNDRMDDPRSGGYVSGITTRGLADRFAWDNQVADCVRSQGSADEAGPSLAPATPQAPAAGAPAPSR